MNVFSYDDYQVKGILRVYDKNQLNKNSLVIGRSKKAHISFKDISVSRKHAFLYKIDDSWVI